MEGGGEQSEEIEYDNDGDPIPRLSSGTERQRGDDDANVPDTLSWTAAAAAPPGEQPTATGFGLFAGPSTVDPEAAAAFLEAVARPVPEHIRAALAGGLLAGFLAGLFFVAGFLAGFLAAGFLPRALRRLRRPGI